MSNVQGHLYLVATELDSTNMECFHPHKNFYYHYSVFPAQFFFKASFLPSEPSFYFGQAWKQSTWLAYNQA